MAKVPSSVLNGVELMANIEFDGKQFTMKIGVPEIKISNAVQMKNINI